MERYENVRENDGQNGPDPVLLAFLNAATDAEAERELARLIEQAALPIISRIVQRRWRVFPSHAVRSFERPGEADAEDARCEAVAQLVTHLRDYRQELDREPIRDFRAYAAVTAYRACDNILRLRCPQRWSLKNRLRYLLIHQSGFALWASADGWFAGFDAWRGSLPGPLSIQRAQALREDAADFLAEAVPQADVRQMKWADLLAEIFDWVRGPVALESLVAAIAVLLDIHESTARFPVQNTEESGHDPMERVPDPRANVEAEVDQRMYLAHLWAEIVQLPARQCAALLLNLRDEQGRGVIELLPLRGVASMPDICAAMEMPLPQFAEVWNDLPLDDNGIARRLGATRQQVINLRKCARERLARRMRAVDRPAIRVR